VNNKTKLIQCKHCGFVYPMSESKMKKRIMFNIEIKEPACPKCECTSFKAVYLPSWMDRYLYVNEDKRYYE